MRILKNLILVCCGIVMSASITSAQSIMSLTAAQAKTNYLDRWKNPNPNEFFKVFLDHKMPDVVIFGMLQPTIEDCLQLFETEYAPSVHMELAKAFADYIGDAAEADITDTDYVNSFSKYESFTFEKLDLADVKKKYPIKEPIAEGEITNEYEFYDLKLEGTSLGAFVYTGTHWVWVITR